ncbi:uncharacterized protein LOC131307163 [Rhododendron vialii]|uniref:uncharacterized protein LOC131307162 n=1 Tax=Rhododendron vialii TaxID=182163 RepID=UPI00265E0099|nr:uncharacterized protein LOC131307162 [Rhododendron vialii]XP_058189555.1 uncharacterized protein LOC131307163 [Rhododendron vialii]
MAPYEAMYGQPCRSPIYWTKVREDALLGSELVRETTEKKYMAHSTHMLDWEKVTLDRDTIFEEQLDTHTLGRERERERESSVRGERRQPYLRPAVPTTGAASPPAAITTNRAHLQPSSIRRSSNRRRSSSHHHHQALIIITTTTDQHLPPPSNPSPAGHHCHWSHLHCRAHHHHRPSSEPPPSLSKPRFAGQKVPKMEQKCSYDSIKFNPNEEEAENHGFCTHSRSD